MWDDQGPLGGGAGASFTMGQPKPPSQGCGGLFRVWIIEVAAPVERWPPSLTPPPRWRRGLLRFGTTEAPGARLWGPTSHFASCMPRRKDRWASFTLGPPRALHQGHGGLLHFGTTEAPAVLARGPPSLWYHPSPLGKGFEASFVFGSSKRPPQERGGHRGPHCMGAKDSFTWGPPRAVPQVRRGVHRVCITKAPAAWARGPRLLWVNPGPSRRPSFDLGAPRPPPQGRGGLLRVWINEAPMAWAWGPPSLWDHRGPLREGMGASFVLGPLRSSL